MTEAEHAGVAVNFRTLWKRLSHHLYFFRWRFIAGLFFIILSTSTELALPIIIGTVVDLVTTRHDWYGLLKLSSLFGLLMVLKACFDTIQAFIIQSTGQSLVERLRVELFQKMVELPVPYFDRNPTGRLLTRVVNDIKSLTELFTASMSVLILDIVVIVGAMITMIVLNWELALYVLAVFPLVFVMIYFFGQRLSEIYRIVRQKLSAINAFLGENLAAVGSIQRLAAEEDRMKRFESISREHREAQMKSLRNFALVQPYTNILNGITTGTLIILGGKWVVDGKISLGVLVAFTGYVKNLFQPIRDIVEKYNIFLSAMVSAERVLSILDEPSESVEPAVSDRGFRRHGSVRFEHVHFHYPSRTEGALSDVSFDLPMGNKLAVVGPTGSGKSTLVRLLLRFYEPDSGTIYFSDRSLREWNRYDLRSQIGVVHQEIYLFAGTLRENLVLGAEGIPESRIIEACDSVGLWSLVQDRGGLETSIQENGSNFSVGERQLLSLARVLLFDPPLVILDEATASIDRRLERKIFRAIRKTLTGRTAIVIAHRLSTIEWCDAVLVLKDGAIAEYGSYEQLATGGALFQKFLTLQTH